MEEPFLRSSKRFTRNLFLLFGLPPCRTGVRFCIADRQEQRAQLGRGILEGCANAPHGLDLPLKA
jgi:hypothetical protein